MSAPTRISGGTSVRGSVGLAARGASSEASRRGTRKCLLELEVDVPALELDTVEAADHELGVLGARELDDGHTLGGALLVSEEHDFHRAHLVGEQEVLEGVLAHLEVEVAREDLVRGRAA